MLQGRRSPFWIALNTPVQWARDRSKRWRRPPPEVGVREPRRPKPALPATALALDEPPTYLRRWLKLINRRDVDQA